jgi:hypothetical protein
MTFRHEWKANTLQGAANYRYLLGHGTRRVEVLTDETGLVFREIIRCPESQRIEGFGSPKRFADCFDSWTVLIAPPVGEPFDCAPQVIDMTDEPPAPSTIDACDPIYL